MPDLDNFPGDTSIMSYSQLLDLYGMLIERSAVALYRADYSQARGLSPDIMLLRYELLRRYGNK